VAEEKRTRPVEPESRERLRDVVDKRGPGATARLTGIPSATVARILSGLDVRQGTRLQLEQSLRDLDEHDADEDGS
jgi:hypothetical protein